MPVPEMVWEGYTQISDEEREAYDTLLKNAALFVEYMNDGAGRNQERNTAYVNMVGEINHLFEIQSGTNAGNLHIERYPIDY